MSISAVPVACAAERELLARYHESDDLAARRELVERFLPFARSLAQRYAYTEESLDDLTQVACIGLLKAIDRYMPDQGASFKSYAAPTILGELKRHFRDKGWAVRVPRGLQERALQAARISEEIAQRLGRSPSVREVAAELGCSAEELLEAYEAGRSFGAASLDAPGSGEQEAAPLLDLIGSSDPGYDAVAEQEILTAAWRQIPPLEQRILELRFFRGLSQAEIGRAVGFSQMHVSRLMRRAIEKLEQTDD